jgi:hypothetical protein
MKSERDAGDIESWATLTTLEQKEAIDNHR